MRAAEPVRRQRHLRARSARGKRHVDEQGRRRVGGCWKAKGKPSGSEGYGDTQKNYATLALTPGDAGKAKIAVKLKGAAFDAPTLPATALPLRAQLQGAGRCWDTSFVADDVQTNTGTQLKAKGP